MRAARLSPEELALHRIGGANEPYGALMPEEVELAAHDLLQHLDRTAGIGER